MFADHELIGIPHRIVVGDRGLKEGNIEYKGRADSDSQQISLLSVHDFLKDKINIQQLSP
jgi:prolyl-tRNA synthetase